MKPESDQALQEFFASLSTEFEEDDTDKMNRQLVPEGQRKCPICSEFMVSTHEHGVLIDTCDEHGMWLDKGELRAIVRRSQDSDLVKQLKERVTEEQMRMRNTGGEGFLLGYALGILE